DCSQGRCVPPYSGRCHVGPGLGQPLSDSLPGSGSSSAQCVLPVAGSSSGQPPGSSPPRSFSSSWPSSSSPRPERYLPQSSLISPAPAARPRPPRGRPTAARPLPPSRVTRPAARLLATEILRVLLALSLVAEAGAVPAPVVAHLTCSRRQASTRAWSPDSSTSGTAQPWNSAGRV